MTIAWDHHRNHHHHRVDGWNVFPGDANRGMARMSSSESQHSYLEIAGETLSGIGPPVLSCTTRAAVVSSTPGVSLTQGRREEGSGTAANTSLLDCRKCIFRDHCSTAVRWGCRSLRSRRNSNNVGSPKFFRDRSQHHNS